MEGVVDVETCCGLKIGGRHGGSVGEVGKVLLGEEPAGDAGIVAGEAQGVAQGGNSAGREGGLRVGGDLVRKQRGDEHCWAEGGARRSGAGCRVGGDRAVGDGESCWQVFVGGIGVIGVRNFVVR